MQSVTANVVAPKIEKSEKRFVFASLAFVVVLLLVGIFRHEMWRDELQAWCLARDSATLLEVHKHLLYEGHPISWYLPLFLLTRVTHDPFVMQLLNISLISGACYLVLAYAPFQKWQRLVFCLGYFPIFEYGIISRSYSLELLVLVAFCALYKFKNEHPWWLISCLVAMAAVNAYGMMLAFALMATLTVDYWLNRKKQNFSKLVVALGALLVVASAGLTVLQVTAPSDGFHGELTVLKVDPANRWFKAFRAIPISYAPIPNYSVAEFWNTDLVSKIESEPLTIALITAVAVGCFTALLATPPSCFLYAIGTGGLVYFSYTRILGGLRQQGHLFLILFSALWLAHFVTRWQHCPAFIQKISNDKNRSILLSVVLCLQLIAGIYAYVQDVLRPFASAKLVARFIKQKHLQNALIIGSNDHEMTSVSGYLDRKIYCPESKNYTSFVINNTSRHNTDFNDLARESLAVMDARHVDEAVLILNYQLGAIPPGLKVECLNIFDKSIQADERFWVYKITRADKQQSKN